MIEVRIGAFARGRLWEPTELPAATGRSVADRVIKADTKVTAPPRSLAVEVVIPRGLVVSYGLLGGTYGRAPDGLLKMSVLGGGRGAFEGSLASPAETVLFGLPSEYIESIAYGFFAGVNRLSAIPGGSLTFDRGAHGRVGSSPLLFRQLAACVTRIVLGDPVPWDNVLREELKLQ